MDANLIIDDDYVTGVGRAVKTRGKQLEEILDKYATILGEIEAEAIMSGSISDSLAAFRECVLLLNDKLSTISDNVEYVTRCFITDVNTADDYLF